MNSSPSHNTMSSPTKRMASKSPVRSPNKKRQASPARFALSPKTSNIASPFKKSSVINPFTRSSPIKQKASPQKPQLGFTIWEDKNPRTTTEVDHPESNEPSSADQENILQPRNAIERSSRLPLRNLSVVEYPAEVHFEGHSMQLHEAYEFTEQRRLPGRLVGRLYTNVPSYVTPSRRSCRYIVRSGVEEEEVLLLNKRRSSMA